MTLKLATKNCWFGFIIKSWTKQRKSLRITKQQVTCQTGSLYVRVWFTQTACPCTLFFPGVASEGYCIWGLTTERKHRTATSDPICASGYPPDGEFRLLRQESLLGVVHKSNNEVHSLPPSCRWCSWIQGHFHSSFFLQTCSLSRQPPESLLKTSASHSLCKEQGHHKRKAGTTIFNADSAETTAAF